MKKVTYYLVLLTVIAASVLSACANQQTPAAGEIATSTSADAASVASEGVIAEGHLIPARDTTLSFQGAGTVMEVKAKTGDKVKKGDELARLGGVSDAAYAAAQLELVNAQQALKNLQENADASERSRLGAPQSRQPGRKPRRGLGAAPHGPCEPSELSCACVASSNKRTRPEAKIFWDLHHVGTPL